MSNLKFRAWDEEKHTMFRVVDMNFFSQNTMCTIDREDVKHPACVSIPFNDLLILQFTGISDRNGIDIYKGDILKVFVDGDLSPITPDGKDFVSKVEYLWGAYALPMKDDYALLGAYLNKTEVIGNIYENPELLESVSHE